jgi:hypothetical protein
MDFITTEQIIAHRVGRKKSGLIGCIDGVSDIPLTSLKGMSWRPADPMNPDCFCHDCRTTWDSDGSIDLELIKRGNERACYVYASLLPSKKETLLELMAKADDALEDFVKAQMELVAKMEIIKDFSEKIATKEDSYSCMTRWKSYDYIKAHEQETDLLEMEIRRLKTFRSYHEKDAAELEANVREKETALGDARKKMRAFLDKNF